MQDDHEADGGAKFLVPSMVDSPLPLVRMVPGLLQGCRNQEREANTDTFKQENAEELDLAVLGHGPDSQAGDGAGKQVRNWAIEDEYEEHWVDEAVPEVLSLCVIPLCAELPISEAFELHGGQVLLCVLLQVFTIASDLAQVSELLLSVFLLCLLDLVEMIDGLRSEFIERGPIRELRAFHELGDDACFLVLALLVKKDVVDGKDGSDE